MMTGAKAFSTSYPTSPPGTSPTLAPPDINPTPPLDANLPVGLASLERLSRSRLLLPPHWHALRVVVPLVLVQEPRARS